jgi:hypothetical protein
MVQSREAAVLNTYRYLRLATIPLLLMLLISAGLESLRGEPCLLGSISAYYYTPARGAFIGGLFAVGACLIVYKGNDPLEDVLLDFSGFMAFVVALVPTVADRSCGDKYPAQNLDGTADAIRNNVMTLLVVTVLAVAAKWWLVRRDRRRGAEVPIPFEVVPVEGSTAGGPGDPKPVPAVAPDTTAVRWARPISKGCLVVLFVELGLFVLLPDLFNEISHSVAAVTMVIGVIGVMIANARGFARVEHEVDEPAIRTWVNRYSIVAATMVGLIGLAVVTHVTGITNDHTIFIVELVVIVSFLVFWGMQTAELWDYPTRRDKVVAEGTGERVTMTPFERFTPPTSRHPGKPGP